MSSYNDILQEDFNLWVENLTESTAALTTQYKSTTIAEKNSISLLQERLDEVEVDITELEKFRPTASKRNVVYQFSSALKPLSSAKRAVQKAKTMLAEAGKSTNANGDSTFSNPSSARRMIPEVKIHPFTGDIVAYHSFITAFNLKYDSLPITKKEKLQHLKDNVQGDPLKAIQTLDLTDDNYDRALVNLKAKYDKKDDVIDALYQRLEQLPEADNSNASLTSSYIEIEGILTALESHQHSLDSFPPLRKKVYYKYPQWLIHQICGKTKPPVKEFQEGIADTLSVRSTLNPYAVSRRRHTSLTLHANNNRNDQKQPEKAHRNNTGDELKRNQGDRPLPTCVFCNQKHYSNDCTVYTTLAERRPLLKGRCYLCLSKEHQISACKKSTTCRFCKKVNAHHASLCPQQYEKQTSQKNQNNLPSAGKSEPDTVSKKDDTDSVVKERVVGFIRTHQGAHTTALVTVVNPETSRKYTARVLFDNGSSDTYISESAARRFGLALSRFQTAPVTVFAVGQPVKVRTASTSFLITNNNKFNINVVGDTVPNLPQNVQLFNYESFKEIHPRYSDLHFINQGCSQQIDILLGGDYYFDILEPETKITIHEGLYLLKTAFGWMLVGRSSQQDLATSGKSILFQMSPSQAVKALTSLEAIGIKDEPLSVLQEEENALNQFYQNIEFVDNRYQIRWPWKEFPPPLQNNFGLAIGILKSQQRKLSQKSFEDYNAVIQSQLDAGIVEEVPNTDTSSPNRYYIPHHAVLTPQKSTPIRIVYNGQAKPARAKYSINDVIYKGRNLLADSCGIIIRFRFYPIVTVSDLEKAFHQLSIHPNDRDYVCFLWLFDWKKPPKGDNLRVLRFLRVAFGIDASPFLLYATIRYHLQKHKNKVNSETIEKILRDIFADNINTGFKNYEKAIQFYHIAVELFRICSMNLRAWATNDEKLRSELQQVNGSSSISILGVRWNQYDDKLKIHKIGATDVYTLRNVLSVVSMFYDPCGWWSPLITLAKTFIHDLHLSNYNWDDELSTDHKSQWKEIQSSLLDATNVTFPRYQFDITDPAAEYELHVFSDASEKAYACVIYIRRLVQGKSDISLIMSKSRIAPQKPEYKIPKLELFAVVLAVRTLVFLREQIPVTFKNTTLWCDSKCVLSWLKGTKILPLFIQRRVDYIRSTSGLKFRYVASADNPADLPSRGGTLDQVASFWSGPEWLKNETDWPQECHVDTLVEDNIIEKPINQTVVVITTPKYPFDINPEKFSSYLKLLRVTTYVMQFLKAFTIVRRRNLFPKTSLHAAAMLWLRMEQSNHYYEVICAIQHQRKNELIAKLNVYIDTNGMLRCAGRFQFAPLSPNEKAPLLLPAPKVSHFVVLLIKYYHEICFHTGTSHTLHALRRKFWLPCGRRSVYNVIHRCTKCKRFTARPYRQPDRSDLPNLRLEEETPFHNIGIDTFGPLWCNGIKYFSLIVVDLVIRAIDLELVIGLTTEELFLALRRIIARRSQPVLVLSDNAAQFHLIEKEFKSLYTHEWQWKFLPSHSPWMGGAYERFVGLVKSALSRTFYGSSLSESALRTALAEIAGTLNSRPLTYISQERDDSVLTPNHFLQSYYDLHDLEIPSVGSTQVQKIAKQSTELNNKFWSVWKSAYLQYLRTQATKYKFPKSVVTFSPRIGDVVLVYEQHQKRSKWKIGRITQLNLSADNVIRSVTLRTQYGTIIRPLKEVYPLELHTDDISSVPAPTSLEASAVAPEDDWDNPEITVEEIEDN